jgi:hypothetical protein
MFNIHVECDGRTHVMRRRWGSYNGRGCVRFPNGLAVLEEFSLGTAACDPVIGDLGGDLETPVAFDPVCGECQKDYADEDVVTVKQHRKNMAAVARLRAARERNEIRHKSGKRTRHSCGYSSCEESECESDSEDDCRRRRRRY